MFAYGYGTVSVAGVILYRILYLATVLQKHLNSLCKVNSDGCHTWITYVDSSCPRQLSQMVHLEVNGFQEKIPQVHSQISVLWPRKRADVEILARITSSNPTPLSAASPFLNLNNHFDHHQRIRSRSATVQNFSREVYERNIIDTSPCESQQSH